MENKNIQCFIQIIQICFKNECTEKNKCLDSRVLVILSWNFLSINSDINNLTINQSPGRAKNDRKRLSAGTVHVNKEHLTGTVPVNKEHLTGTVPVNKEHLTGTL